MNLYEYQSKAILSKFGINIPSGSVAQSEEDALNISRAIGLPVAIKAQVLTGGRGKAGGVKIANTQDEVKSFAGQILKMEIKGLPVKKILLEQALKIDHEYYLSLTVDRANKCNTLMFSEMGGVDIEDVAKNCPDKIIKTEIEGTKTTALNPFIPQIFISQLIDAYFSLDALLLEINPLVKTSDGKFFAGDAKIIIDDNALFRHPELNNLVSESEIDEIEAEARKRKIAYVRLPGNIGIIGNGAGLVMSTMDEVKKAGGSPASFLDIGGGAKANLVRSSLELLSMDKNIKGIFLNVFGGITRCDEVAIGIIEAIKTLNINLPIVIRLTGTREKEGNEILSKTNLISVNSIEEGARKIVGDTR